jgi:hypothetical protein
VEKLGVNSDIDREGERTTALAIVETGHEAGQDKDHYAGEFEQLLNIVGQMFVTIRGTVDQSARCST